MRRSCSGAFTESRTHPAWRGLPKAGELFYSLPRQASGRRDARQRTAGERTIPTRHTADDEILVSAPYTGEWELLKTESAEDRARILAITENIAPQQGLGARFYNVTWKLGPQPDWGRLRAFALRENGETRGFAPFLRQRRPLAFHLGEVRVGSAALNRFTLIGEIYLAAQDRPDYREEVSKRLLDTALPLLGPSEALWFEGLPVDSPIYKLVNGGSAAMSRAVSIQIGEAFDHQFISLPPSLGDYLKEMGSRSRQSVQYSARRLEKDMSGSVETVKFDSVGAVDRFLKDAAAISARTYQTTLLGLGIRDNDAMRAQLRFEAERGWLRSYILYCGNEPSAFMLGHQYGGCYYYDDVGYDPKFAKWSVGSVLQLKVLEELFGSPTRPEYFDFSTGYGPHKGRFGNLSRREANVLVLPRTLRNAALATAYRASDGLSKTSVRVLDRLGVKDRLKQFIRRWKS
jgi:CelD/BcsL family acetyltransferase involved in cellulose biosynthesis